MNVTVSGKHISVGEALRTHIETRLDESVSKYLDRVTNVSAVLSKDSHLFRADINAHMGTASGLVIKATGLAGEAKSACDEAIDRLVKQLRRYKRRLTNHHKQPMSEAVKAIKRVLPHTVAEEEKDDHNAVIIAETPTEVQTLTVSEAVMKMDLADLPALLFFNKANGRVNVVYRRADGNISWVDPEGMAA